MESYARFLCLDDSFFAPLVDVSLVLRVRGGSEGDSGYSYEAVGQFLVAHVETHGE